jgi:replication initiation protein RepC
LGIVRDLRRDLGIGDREIAVLGAHLAVLPKGLVSARDLLMSYAEVAGLLERANGMDERRFRRGEARLEEVGLIQRRLSANGRRFPQRNAVDEVVDAYGIDLRPLFMRADELRHWHNQVQEKSRRRTALATRISSLIAEIRRRLEKRLGSAPDVLIEFAQRARAITRRKTATIEELLALEAQIERMTTELETTGAGATDRLQTSPTVTHGVKVGMHLESLAVVHVGEDGAGDMTMPKKDTPTSLSELDAEPTPRRVANSLLPDRTPADAGQIDRQSESHTKESYSSSRDRKPGDIEVWNECKELNSMYPVPPKSLHELGGIIREFSRFLGLGLDQVERALPVLGVSGMVVSLDYLAGRIHQVNQPRAYLSNMVKRFQAGEVIAGGRVRPA